MRMLSALPPSPQKMFHVKHFGTIDRGKRRKASDMGRSLGKDNPAEILSFGRFYKSSPRDDTRVKPAARVSGSPCRCKVFNLPLAPDSSRTALAEM
jgi:hypothetical protein